MILLIRNNELLNISNFKSLMLLNYENETNPFVNYIICIENNVINGYLKFEDLSDRIEIDNIEVDISHRRNGIASSMISFLINYSIDNHYNNITLEVREDNLPAIELYKKHGFENVAIRRGYYKNCNGILMKRDVNMEKKDIYILGIESSCDETACSIVKNGSEIISNVVLSQIDIHTKYGGVVPEIASRKHIENITIVLEECLKKAKMDINSIDGIAVTEGPGLIGSLLVGLESAKTLSFIYDKPLIPVNHIAGHIYANNLVKKIQYPALCLVISGGHTELVLIPNEYEFKVLGSTLDDAVGECYDKVARVIGIGYPGGPKIDKLARKGENKYKLPIPLNDNSYNFSFSGLKSAVINLVHNESQRGNTVSKENLACSFQEVVCSVLSKKTRKAINDYGVKYFITAGGVAANSSIREELSKVCISEKIDFSFPDIDYCTDNAAMIAAAGYFLYKRKKFSSLLINGKSTLNL